MSRYYVGVIKMPITHGMASKAYIWKDSFHPRLPTSKKPVKIPTGEAKREILSHIDLVSSDPKVSAHTGA